MHVWYVAAFAMVSALLVATRLYNGTPFCWRPPAFTGGTRFVGGHQPLQWYPTLLAATRLYSGTRFLEAIRLRIGPPFR